MGTPAGGKIEPRRSISVHIKSNQMAFDYCSRLVDARSAGARSSSSSKSGRPVAACAVGCVSMWFGRHVTPNAVFNVAFRCRSGFHV
jgi:hypothetical protein